MRELKKPPSFGEQRLVGKGMRFGFDASVAALAV
jgi:hypothetical protein